MINIKVIPKIQQIIQLKLTKEQQQEIKDQQSQENKTKRVTVAELENILRSNSYFRSWFY